MQFLKDEMRLEWEEEKRSILDDPEYKDYGTEIMRYAEAWADLMEERMNNGKQLEDIAQETSYTADVNDITVSIYGAAVRLLSYAWEHGERLRVWHNGKYRMPPEKEGIVDPATWLLPKGMTPDDLVQILNEAGYKTVEINSVEDYERLKRLLQ